MMSASAHIQEGFAGLKQAESVIFQTITETTDELAHAECFDEEQRAEIYTILQAIRTDTETHRNTVELMAAKLKNGGCVDA